MLLFKILTFMAICLLQSSAVFSSVSQGQQTRTQDIPQQPVALILELSSSQILRLKQSGNLRTTLPSKVLNRVHSVRLKRQTSFLEKTQTVQAKTDKLNRTVSIEVDDAIIDRLDFQPVEIKIYESNFESIVIAYKPPKRKTQTTASASSPNTTMFFRINDKRGVMGDFSDTDSLQFTAGFGDVKIPLKQISGIRFNAKSEQEVFVTLKNGDAFSATIQWSKIEVKTRWGTKELAVSQLESITADRESRYAVDSKGRYLLLTTQALQRSQFNQNSINQNQFEN